MKQYELKMKRVFDWSISMFCLIMLSPIFLCVPFVMLLTMPGPIFFKQERIGQNGNVFNILKFRTMKVDKEAELAHDFTKDEERITGFGRLMRRTKVDELPQLLNVLWGSMSLVGPRPTVKEQIEKFDRRQMKRLLMRPGMTGLAQVNGNVALEWGERIELDLEYIEKYSLLLDLKIILKTVLVVLFGEEKFQHKKRK